MSINIDPRPSIDRFAGTHRGPWLLALPVLCWLALSVVQPAEASEPVPPIILKAIAFHGGEAYQHSMTELDMCSKSGCFHIASTTQGEDFEHRVSGTSRDTHLKVRVTNETVDRWFDGHPTETLEEDVQRVRDWAMARVYFCFLPYRLTDPSVRHQDLGLVEWEGRKLHLVEVSFAAGSSTDAEDEYRYWFDPESGRLELFAYSYEGKPGGLRFRRIVDHRRVGGILFFDQENLGTEGEGLDVDQINPAFVRDKMKPISKVTLRSIRVTPLP